MEPQVTGGGQGAVVTAPHGTATTANGREREAARPVGEPADLAALVVTQQDIIDRLVTLHRELHTAVGDLTRRVRRLEAGSPPAPQGRG